MKQKKDWMQGGKDRDDYNEAGAANPRKGVQRRDMIEVSIAKLVSSVIAIILSSISIGMSISGLMSLREKRTSKKPVEDRDNKTGRTDK